MTKFWENFSEDEIDELSESILKQYRESGFPYYPALKDEERRRLFDNLSENSWETLIDGDYIKQTMHALGAIWHYFPHSWSVKCGKRFSPMEVFSNDTLFKKAILKRLKYGTYISDSGIRKSLKTASGAQGVSNFRPTAASAIYDFFGGGNVYDMSCGYGGRLLGAIVSKRVTSYIGVEPCLETYDGLLRLEKDFNYKNLPVSIHMIGSEDFIPERESIDLCFTSPPYFDTEKYSHENTQSFIRYPKYGEWIDGFIGSTVINCRTSLKNDGTLIYNVANTKAHPTLEEDVVKKVESLGFSLTKVMFLRLSSIMTTGYKTEPVFVFKKVRT